MSKKDYKLSQTLWGHSLDVRSIAVSANNDIISGSRDKTAKLWKLNPVTNKYEEIITYKDQKNFVASVLYLEPTEAFPDGLILTGGNDNVILVYKPWEPFATCSIKEHSNTVSCLNKTNELNAFLSGSWDTEAKLIKLSTSDAPKLQVTFTGGHSAAIWSVIQLKDSRVVTASADKTIIIWNLQGLKLETLTGHKDCVRSLVDFPELQTFVSVANDAAIKLWSYSGENLNTYYGHTSYIYSIARCPKEGQDCFVTSDEDRTVKIWENGENIQSILLPAQSVWSVQCLANGDIITGSSDGLARIFTRDESRYADEADLVKFNEEVVALQQQSVQEIGGVKVTDLPGPEGLYEPGKRDGQMKMIRQEGKVVAYKWVLNDENGRWDKVGDVMGGTDKDDSGKTIFEGKSYDFVFSVDVEDGKPPLKLPYNRGDDVYQAANKFLTKNLLPADYLEQVVDFILKNSKESYVPTPNAYQDPFTGGNRYTPNYQSNSGTDGINVDPFTGGSSYATSSSKPLEKKSSAVNADPFTGSSSYSPLVGIGNAYFPVFTYRTFDTGDSAVILKKLKEFNDIVTDNKISETDLKNLETICQGMPPNNNDDFKVYELLISLLINWPEEFVFPILDIIRMACRDKTNNENISTWNCGEIFGKIKSFIGNNTKMANNTVVALRILCNLFLYDAGENLMFENRFESLEHITALSQLNKNAQIALGTLLLNLTILSIKKNDDLGYSVLAQVLPDIITKLTDVEAHFRSYVALGTLILQSNIQKAEIIGKINENEQFLNTLQIHGFKGNDLELKRYNCVKKLQELL